MPSPATDRGSGGTWVVRTSTSRRRLLGAVVTGEREKHLVEARLTDTRRRDPELGLAQRDQNVRGAVRVGQCDVEPARFGGEDRVIADHTRDERGSLGDPG